MKSGWVRQGKIVHYTTIRHQDNSIVIKDKGHYHHSSATKVTAQNNQTGSLGFVGLTQDCCNPPDVQIAAGPDYVLEMVNLDGAIYTKNGTSVKALGLNNSLILPIILFQNLITMTSLIPHYYLTINLEDGLLQSLTLLHRAFV